jgi:hypothetical protein
MFCNQKLAANAVVETLPVGRRLAFDPERGRLWVVCQACERWNLTPFDQRWESIETCERLFRGESKRVGSTNVALARLDEGLELVRIGKPPREEFASWRYGDQFGRRRRRTLAHGAIATAAAGAAVAGALVLGAFTCLGGLAYYLGERRLRQSRARHIIASIPTSHDDAVTVLREHLSDVRLKTDFESASRWRLVLPHTRGSTTVSGEYAVQALALLLPTINGGGAGDRMVRRATQRLEGMHDPLDYLKSAAAFSSHGSRPGRQGSVGKLPTDMRLAMEMAANEDSERLAMAGEMWLLEWAWEQAEVIAAIADKLEIPPDLERKLQELKTRAARE